MTTSRRLAPTLALLVFLAQLALAAHAPSHLDLAADAGPTPASQALDCDLCLSGQAPAPPPTPAVPFFSPQQNQLRHTGLQGPWLAPLIPSLGARGPPTGC